MTTKTKPAKHTSLKDRIESAIRKCEPIRLMAIKADLEDSLAAGRATPMDFSDYVNKHALKDAFAGKVKVTRSGEKRDAPTTAENVTNSLRFVKMLIVAASDDLLNMPGRGSKRRRQHADELTAAGVVIGEWITAGKKNGYR